MRALIIALVLVIIALAAGCGPVPAKDVGAQLFKDPRLTASDVNAFSCATCHAVGDAGDALFPGADLKTAAVRTRFWGGNSANLLDATNACIHFFMRGEPMSKDDPRGRALYEYLASEAKGATDTADKPLSIVENVSTVPKGSKARGEQVWNAACRSCHGDPHTGNGRITDTASLVPEASIEFLAALKKDKGDQITFGADLVVVEKVRHGGFFGVGGTMPPFSRESMSDEDLGALLAFLGL